MNVNALRVVRPMAVVPSLMVANNVPETDYPEWIAGTTYALGARVIVAAQHKVYQSAVAGNVGQPPATSPTQWGEVGATNAWKAFDQSISTQTKRSGLISFRIKPGQVVHSVAALNLVGAGTVRVRMEDPALGTVYDKTTSLAGHLLASTWWDWFFGARTERKQLILTDLPSVPTADILIDITGTTDLAVGVIVLGKVRTFSLGIKAGARIGFQDFSRKEKNEFGDTVLVERAFARRANFSMLLRASEVDAFDGLMTEVRAIPCLWIGSNFYEATTVYGISKSFDIVLSYTDFSDCDLELEGLT